MGTKYGNKHNIHYLKRSKSISKKFHQYLLLFDFRTQIFWQWKLWITVSRESVFSEIRLATQWKYSNRVAMVTKSNVIWPKQKSPKCQVNYCWHSNIHSRQAKNWVVIAKKKSTVTQGIFCVKNFLACAIDYKNLILNIFTTCSMWLNAR